MIFARWVLLIGAITAIGAFGATLLSYPADARVMRASRRLSWILPLGAFLIITAQLFAWFGIDGLTNPENAQAMITITLWGLHWSWLAAASVIVVTLFHLAAWRPRIWIVASAIAAVAVTAFVPLVGHGGTHDAATLIWHRMHLLGAGLWIGSLTITLVAGLSDPLAMLTKLRRFAPLALTGASLIAISGTALAWRHMRPLSTLWTTDYGLVLLTKAAAAIGVGSLGFLNWRAPRTRLVVAEVLTALLVVLALTAWLSELELPRMAH